MSKRYDLPDRVSMLGIIHRDICNLPKDLPKREWIASLMRAHIPMEYWYIDFRSFQGDRRAKLMVQKYCEKIDEARKGGFGFLLSGPNGIGKTTLITLTLQEVIRHGYSAFYITLPEIFSLIHRSYDFPMLLPEIDTILKDTEFLAVGELGKDYHRGGAENYAIAEFDSFFRYRRGACLPTLLDTNMSADDRLDTYGESLISLLKARTPEIIVKGTDYRDRVQLEEANTFLKLDKEDE